MRVSFLWQAGWEGGSGMTPHTTYRSFHDHLQWSIFTVGLMGLELPWKHSEWVCEHVFQRCIWARKPQPECGCATCYLAWSWKPDWRDKGIHGRYTRRKTGTGWLVQTLLGWCQLDNNSETQWVYRVQHKEADSLLLWVVSVGSSLRFWSCGRRRVWLLGFALPVNILTQTRGRQCQIISMGLRS